MTGDSRGQSVGIRRAGSPPVLSSSTDSKTSPVVVRRAKKFDDPIRAAFGTSPGPMSAGGSCPGATAACWPEGANPSEAVCYVGATLRYRAVGDLLARNFDSCETTLETDGWRALGQRLADELIAPAFARADKYGAARIFRWFWSGDVWSVGMARAIAHAVNLCDADGATGEHWIYTRNHRLPVVRALLTAPSLSVYLSVDRYNVKSARRVVAGVPRGAVNIAPMADTADGARQLLADVRADVQSTGPTIVCPVGNRGSWRNVVPAAGPISRAVEVGETAAGACSRCRHCVAGKGDVLFPIH